jgi:hypothetical protein
VRGKKGQQSEEKEVIERGEQGGNEIFTVTGLQENNLNPILQLSVRV